MIGEQTREFYRRQGELRERERIIKLLKEEQDAANATVNWDYDTDDQFVGY